MKHGALVKHVALFVVSALPAIASAADNGTARPLPQAHAHNDYAHRRPLADALEHGFCSVEADIHLVDGQLLVAHDRRNARPDRTLEGLYLEPLRRRVQTNGGKVYPGGPVFTLLIDIKSNGTKTYAGLRKVLARYGEMLTAVRDGQVQTNAVTVVISGNRPWALVAAEAVRYAGVDGRISDLDSDKPVHLMPLISDNWRKHFKWRGRGAMSDAERTRLDAWVKKAHQRGRRIRFWAIPDRPAAWRELLAAGVDLINTDNLGGLQKFLLAQPNRSGRPPTDADLNPTLRRSRDP